MHVNISLFTSQITQFLQNSSKSEIIETLEDICSLLQSHLKAKVRLTDTNDTVIIEIFASESPQIEAEINQIAVQPLILPNTEQRNKKETAYKLSMPIIAAGRLLGSLILQRNSSPFEETEQIAANIVAAMCTILMQYQEEKTAIDKKRRVTTVRAVINNLSFSELEAAAQAIQAISQSTSEINKSEAGKREGILIAGHIADNLGFTRSVVTGALKKLESAGVIETRSLGMKGTYIRILDPLIADELGKL